MAYTFFGRTGVRVSKLALGAMNFGSRANADHEDAIRVIHAALDSGINFIDTADIYSKGESETIVGKALTGGRRDNVFLATKFYRKVGDDINEQGSSRRWIRQAVENSLRRLGTDHIDLYQAHRHDPHVDLEDTLSTLTDLVAEGKIRYFGSSAFPASVLVESQWLAATQSLRRPSSEQPPYSILVRSAERDVLPTAHRYGLGVLSYSPLAGGWLSGRYDRPDPENVVSSRDSLSERFDLSLSDNQRKLTVVTALAELAREAGVPLAHLAIAFVLRHPGITSAIIGPRNLEQLTGLIGADEIGVDESIWQRIDELVAPGTVLGATEEVYEPPARAVALSPVFPR